MSADPFWLVAGAATYWALDWAYRRWLEAKEGQVSASEAKELWRQHERNAKAIVRRLLNMELEERCRELDVDPNIVMVGWHRIPLTRWWIAKADDPRLSGVYRPWKYSEKRWSENE